MCVHVSSRGGPTPPVFARLLSALRHSGAHSDARGGAHACVCIAHSQLPTHQESDEDRPCRLTQKLLILLSAAMNDLPRPISEFRNEFNTNNDSGRIL